MKRLLHSRTVSILDRRIEEHEVWDQQRTLQVRLEVVDGFKGHLQVRGVAVLGCSQGVSTPQAQVLAT